MIIRKKTPEISSRTASSGSFLDIDLSHVDFPKEYQKLLNIESELNKKFKKILSMSCPYLVVNRTDEVKGSSEKDIIERYNQSKLSLAFFGFGYNESPTDDFFYTRGTGWKDYNGSKITNLKTKLLDRISSESEDFLYEEENYMSKTDITLFNNYINTLKSKINSEL